MFYKTRLSFGLRNFAIALFASASLAACSEAGDMSMTGMEMAEGDFERGPHGSRLLRDGDFSLEVTVFETGVPPELRIYPFMNDEPINPGDVQLAMAVSRLAERSARSILSSPSVKPEFKFISSNQAKSNSSSGLPSQ